MNGGDADERRRLIAGLRLRKSGGDDEAWRIIEQCNRQLDEVEHLLRQRLRYDYLSGLDARGSLSNGHLKSVLHDLERLKAASVVSIGMLRKVSELHRQLDEAEATLARIAEFDRLRSGANGHLRP